MPEDEKKHPSPEGEDNPPSYRWLAPAGGTKPKISLAEGRHLMIHHKKCFCHLYFAGLCVKWGPPPAEE